MKRIFISIVILLPFLFISVRPFIAIAGPKRNAIPQQDVNLLLRGKIDSIVTAFMKENSIVGVSIGVMKNNAVFYTKGYGVADIKKNIPVDSLTNFMACSVSKLFTATAIMQLSEQGKIDIHNKLVFYFPEFKMEDQRYKDITILQMLNHSSGLPNPDANEYSRNADDSLALRNYVMKPKFKKLIFAPGNGYYYSNWAYDMLGYLVERISNESFEAYVYNHILEPAGMVHSSFNYFKIPPERRSVPYNESALFKRIKPAKTYPYFNGDGPCGMLNTCAFDLSKWMVELQHIYADSTHTYKGIISHNTLMQMWTPTLVLVFESPDAFVGLSWFERKGENFPAYYYHTGHIPGGYSARLTMWPGENLGIVVLSNSDYANDVLNGKISSEIETLFEAK